MTSPNLERVGLSTGRPVDVLVPDVGAMHVVLVEMLCGLCIVAPAVEVNSFGVNSVYLRTVPISSDGTAEMRTARACEGVHMFVRAMSSPLDFFCFRARLARKCERSDPRVDFIVRLLALRL